MRIVKPRQGWNDYSAQASRRSDKWAASDRGWLFGPSREGSLGNYLDYGPDHRRYDETERDQPGTIHAIVYRLGPVGFPAIAHYFETVAEAKAWIEQTAAKVAAGEVVAA